jgi:hypothetical protein
MAAAHQMSLEPEGLEQRSVLHATAEPAQHEVLARQEYPPAGTQQLVWSTNQSIALTPKRVHPKP